ncbi:hypothetical protein [Streptomyces nanshensis]|uniref:hypothetical protein n=1 Tax=Streptomyces nanshensis TaxID=518642 RepID=UPI00085C017C|nr:hypothetical protein [Streptomyces nanshensis]
MNPAPSTETCYIATRPDGVIPASAAAGTPVNLADHIGETIGHPNPGRRWYDDPPFSHFCLVTEPGEALDDPQQWPARLFIVEYLGIAGDGDPRFSPHQRYAHAIRVVEETNEELALGPKPRGQETLDYLNNVLPGQAAHWAQAWMDNPDRMAKAFNDWRLSSTADRARGIDAQTEAAQIARATHRRAALNTMLRLARETAEHAARDHGADDTAVHFAGRYARNTITAVLFADSLTTPSRNALRGAGLHTDTSPTP